MAATSRITWQRRAVTQALAAHDGFRSAQHIHADLRQAGHTVGLATVYRNLGLLAAAGELDTLVRDDGETLYRRCSPAHHHHLVCRSCGRTVEVVGPAVETWVDRIATEHGFSQVSHRLELVGICRDCDIAGGSLR